MQASQLPLFFQHLETELAQAPNEIRRLFHGRGRRFEGLEQITCDWLQGQLIINLFKEVDDAFLAELKSGLNALAQSQLWADKQGRTMVLQHRYADGAPSEVLVGELDARPVVEESGLKYQLDIGRNQN
ncbi:class I SAM-dependent methyltransferase, partial [Vibrio parahaemolyticus]